MNEYFGCYQGTWSEYFELFKADQIGFGNWFDVVLEWWNHRDIYNIYFVKYEDLQKVLLYSIMEFAPIFLSTLAAKELICAKSVN